jgi:hypothetical protein
LIDGIGLAKHLLLPPPSLICAAAVGTMVLPFRQALDVPPTVRAANQSHYAIHQIVGICAYEAAG